MYSLYPTDPVDFGETEGSDFLGDYAIVLIDFRCLHDTSWRISFSALKKLGLWAQPRANCVGVLGLGVGQPSDVLSLAGSPAPRVPLPAGKQIQVLSGHLQWVYCCSISPDCSMLCSAAGEKSVRLRRWLPFPPLPECSESWRLGSVWERVGKARASSIGGKVALAGGTLASRALLLHASDWICMLT